jgi:hypothetical protein
MIAVTRKLHIRKEARGRQRIAKQPALQAAPGRVLRVSRLMSLAIRFERLIADGEVADQSELARLAHVSQPRMTQIMNLLHLAPDIQEELLFLPCVMEGKEAIHEKLLRPIAAEVSWARQREMWAGVKSVT